MNTILRRLLPPVLLLGLALTAHADGDNESLEFISPSTGGLFIRWHAVAGRTYFVQVSYEPEPLATWTFAPAIESGDNVPIDYELHEPDGGFPDKGFFRLKYTDQALATGETPETADFDGDGLSNWDELTIYFTDPLNPDTDGDGLPDGWEVAHNLNPNDSSDAANLFPGSNVSNLQAFNAGVQANPNATMSNFDGDDLDNDDDADPNDRLIDWRKSVDPNFAVIELPVTGPSSLWIDDLSENGTVLFSRIINGSYDERVLVDSHQGVRYFPRIAQTLYEFGSICPTLIEDLMFGIRLVPNQDFTGLIADLCTWNPLDNTYVAFDWWYYEDSIIDARNGYWLNCWLNPVTNEFGDGLYTRQGELPDSEFMYNHDNSRIEKNGNIRSSGGYWRCEHAANSTITYGSLNKVAEDTGGFSATLIQKSATPQGDEVQKTWNLVPGGTCLHVSKDTASFVQTKLHFGSSRYPLAATSQGWVATPSEIWLNGDWHPLSALLSEITPYHVSLLDMRDTGLSVADIQYTNGGIHKLALLVPVEMDFIHREKERDDEGNELTTIIKPGRNMLLRDEIADLRIKVPTINGTDWNMKIDIDTPDIQTATLGDRGSIQMYDFGKVENGTVTPLTTNSDGSRKVGPYDINLPTATDGEATFRFVVNKEGTFRLRLTSSDNKINVRSQEFTVTKRIRKYATREQGGQLESNDFDTIFENSPNWWPDWGIGDTVGNYTFKDSGSRYTPELLKAISWKECDLHPPSAAAHGTNQFDIMQVNAGNRPGSSDMSGSTALADWNDRAPTFGVEVLIDGSYQERQLYLFEADPPHGVEATDFSIRKMRYSAAGLRPIGGYRDSVKWSLRKLLYKQYYLDASGFAVTYRVKGAGDTLFAVGKPDLRSLDDTVRHYGDITAEYPVHVFRMRDEGIATRGTGDEYRWPRLTNDKARH